MYLYLQCQNVAQMKLRFYLRAIRCSVGCIGTPTIYTSYLGIQIRPTIMPSACSDSVIEHPGLLSWVCMRPIINIVQPHQFSITNLILLISGCMNVGTLRHISKHMSRRSNNNNIINNNIKIWFQLCCLIVIGLYLHYLCIYLLTCYLHGFCITSHDTSVTWTQWNSVWS